MLIAPGSVPAAVTLAAARAQLHRDDTDEDELIQSLVIAATSMAEHELGRSLVTQEWGLRLVSFPMGNICLAKPPVQSITSIDYTDPEGAARTLAAADYSLVPDPQTPWVAGAWPVGTDVRVKFVAGYGAEEDVPVSIQRWILMHVSTWFRNRESAGAALHPMPGISSLLDRYRIWNAL